jgi:serine/threonine protein kinase
MPRRLGRYELISELAKGGMGAVYLARTRGVGGFERLVVVKCALPSLTEQTQQMLLAEARLAATLSHTNIVQVHDVDTDDGTVFLAMEFLHGQDARYLLRRSWGRGRPLPLDSAIAIALAVCAGLHYAHERRDAFGQPLEIVHRDVSPSNVFVTYDGGVKLIDFGIAKATALPSETQLGSVKGKPGYMSPEQCRCEPLDRRSDVFCVGILLYEMTLGRKPFRADNEYLLHKQIIEDDPPRPTSLDPAYPASLEALVMRAVAKDRRARPPTALALQEALTELAASRRLDVSQFALGRYMARLFVDELAAWHDASRSGQSLVDHVIKRATSTVQIIEAAQPAETRSAVGTAETGPAIPIAMRSDPMRRRRWLFALGLAAVGAAVAVTVVMREPSGGDVSGATPTGATPTGATPTGAMIDPAPPANTGVATSPPSSAAVAPAAASSPKPPDTTTSTPTPPATRSQPARPPRKPPRVPSTSPRPAAHPRSHPTHPDTGAPGPDDIL